jgi:hypothetical protein
MTFILFVILLIIVVIEGRQIAYHHLVRMPHNKELRETYELLGISAEQRNKSGMSDQEAQRILDKYLGGAQ